MATSQRPTYKFSMKLPECIKKLALLDSRAEELGKQLQAIEDERSALDAHVLTLLKNSGESLAGTPLGKVELKERDVIGIENFDELKAYILKTKDFALLQQRCATTHARALLDAGKAVPGLKRMAIPYVKFTPSKQP